MPKQKNNNKYKANYRKAELRRLWRTYEGNYMYGYYFLGGNTYFRAPKTTAERRAAIRAKEDGVRVRAKRNHKNLPNAWDDIRIIRSNPHSWKDNSKRRHQYLAERTVNDNLIQLAFHKASTFYGGI